MDRNNTTSEILTVSEARRRLPLINPIIRRIMRTVGEASRIERSGRAANPDTEKDPERAAELVRLEALQREFEEALAELNALGAILKDAERGLVDFFGWIDDEVVHLCWLHGEETIDYWHAIHSGFAGRTRIREDQT